MADSARDIVFISYRRSDASAWALLIQRAVQDAVEDRADVYIDVDANKGGKDFRIQLEQAITRTRVMIVVIASTWLTASKGDGVWWRTFLPFLKPPRRLDDPDDYVRNELRSALLNRRITVLPVRVDGMRMPEPSELPEDIRGICFPHAVSLRHESFRGDAQRLVKDVLDALAEPEPPPEPEQEKPVPLPVKAGVAPAASSPQHPLQPAKRATPPASPKPQPASAELAATLAAARRKMLANLGHLHAAAVTCDSAARKAAHSQYVPTLDVNYVKEFGIDPFVSAYRSAVSELDAWRQDNVMLSRARYWVPAGAFSYALVIGLVFRFDLYSGIKGILDEIAGGIIGVLHWIGDMLAKAVVPSSYGSLNLPTRENSIISLLRSAPVLLSAVGTGMVLLGGGVAVVGLLNLPFMALAAQWRLPHCDAALAAVRVKLDAPAAPAKTAPKP